MVDFQERDTRRGIGDTTDRFGESDGDAADGGDDDGQDGDGGGPGGSHEHGAGNEHGHHDDHEQPEQHDDDGQHDEHHEHDVETLGVGVVTVSSSRSIETDPSGDAIASAFEDAGHALATRELVPDAYDRVQDVVDTLVGRRDVDVVVTTGGTGVTPDDVTIEAVKPLFEKRLPGFGELFRRRSEAQIGTRVVATRATAGVADGVPVFCLPGSEAAVELGVSEIIIPEAGHLAGLAHRDEEEE